MELPPTIERKEYQLDAACGVVAQWEAGRHSTLLIMPTGTGKTITAGLVSKFALDELGRSTLYIAHRTELIQQATKCYVNAFGCATAVEQGSQSERDFVALHGQEPEVLVATVQSLHVERLMARFRQNRFGLIVIDEAHHSAAQSYQDVLNYFQDYYLLGITATPDGASKNLGARYESIAYQMRFADAVADGHLVSVVYRVVPVPVDLREIKCTGGDYNMGELAERISPLVETIAFNIRPHLGQRQTVIFTPDVGSAQAMADMLTQMGTPAEYVAGEGGKFGLGRTLRAERLERFGRREFQVICCCDLLVEGWDMPSVSCVVICRPTRKPYKYRQMAGRCTRLCEAIGKVDGLIIDLDWQTDKSSRDLCRVHELFAEGVDKETLDLFATEIKRRSGSGKSAADLDVLRLLKELQTDTHKSRLLKVRYTGKQTELYRHTDSDPVGVGRILNVGVRKKDFNMRGGGRAAGGQIEALRRLGIHGGEKMSLWGAGRLLSRLESRERKGLASHQQVKRMLGAGVDEEQARAMSLRDASSVIADIKQHETQGEMFGG
jgi:superfamily II DNA or RNA helicase